MARLPGNLGYLDLRYFDNVELGGSTAVAAMAFLAHTDAVIVDLRQNGGGEPAMVQLLASYFFGPERVHYNSFYSRGSDSLEQYWTLARVEGDRMPEVPLYILTARRTGSAAEGFSYALQALERATIIGQPTAGAAHPGETFDAIEGFSIFISTGKPLNPVTGSNWEKTGVQPDIEMDADEALDRARVLALEELLQAAASPVVTLEREWALEAILALRDPHLLAPEQSVDYVGSYGNRDISEQEGHLFYRRGDRRSYEMVFLGDDRFLLDGKSGFRLEFERDADGSIIRLLDHWSDGHVEANTRD
ncbi:MAG: S41 family peptidase [Acidobacteriota bacterium]